MLTAALGAAALSGTLFVPASILLASPAPAVAAAEMPASPLPVTVPAPATPVAQSPTEPAQAVEAPAREAPAAVDALATTSVGDRELDCMTRVILYEAGSEPRAGQVAVAQVVMNRVRSRRFPNSICGVVYQRGQFSAIRSFNPPRNRRWQRAMALASDVLNGHEPVVGNALYFHAARVRPAFVANRTRVARIGNHIFYR